MSEREIGIFPARVLEVVMGETNDGKAQLAVQLQLLSSFDQDPLAPALPEGLPTRMTWYGFFAVDHSDKAQKVTENALRNLGWDPLEHDWNLEEILGTDLIVGAECTVTVFEEDVQDPESGDFTTRMRIRWINSKEGPGIGIRKKMEAPKIQTLQEALRARAKMRGQPRADMKPRTAQVPKDAVKGELDLG